jgi:N-acetylglucosamine kinase-like BadF-type ATPase
MSETYPPVVLGVDGGGTKTIAILSDLQGRVLGYGRAGNCDIYSNPSAIEEVSGAVERACTHAGIRADRISSAVYSLAGADWPEDFSYWRAALEERCLGRRIEVINDAVGVLNSDIPDGNAVVVVCGTGAAIGSRNLQGETWHSSFWQLTQGGSELSNKVLHAVYRSSLGIAPPTSLTIPVLSRYAATSVEDLLHMFTSRERQRPAGRASLVPILFQEAEAGDKAAIDIVRQHGRALADFAITAARKVDIADKEFHLLLTGGIFRNRSRLMRDSLLDRMRDYSRAFNVIDGRSEPVKGAVMCALRSQCGGVSLEMNEMLDRTFPAKVFFETS